MTLSQWATEIGIAFGYIEKSIILESSNGRESTNLGRVVMCRSGETVLEGFSIKEQKSLGKKGTRISSWLTLPPKIEKYRKEVSLREPRFFTSFTEVNASGGRVVSMDSSPIYSQLYDYEMYGLRKRWWDQCMEI